MTGAGVKTPLLTHRVAVGAYMFYAGRMLLLQRAHAPFTYAPPGGKLEVNEDPLTGLQREVTEETALTIRVLGVAETWFDRIVSGGEPLLCINFIAETDSADFTLSSEHTAGMWVTEQELAAGGVMTQDAAGKGYRPTELLRAFQLFRRFSV
jgi:ADP-ribose pyrophosphatase YjhB (NUDIX family)